MPKTGDRCTQIGRYASECGPQWIVHVRHVGSEFPRCAHCDRPVHYRYVAPSPKSRQASLEAFDGFHRVTK
jgi:hypothetical protein